MAKPRKTRWSSAPPGGGSPLGSDLPELQKARALWLASRFDESLRLFEEAVRRAPQNLLALVDASRALGARFEIARAEAMLDRLIKLAGHRPDVLHLAGQSYRMIYRPEKALDCFKRALSLARQLPDAQLELAVLYERRHQLDEAFSMVQDCLHAEPDYAEAKLVLARLLRRQRDEAASEALLRELVADERPHPLVRAQAWNGDAGLRLQKTTNLASAHWEDVAGTRGMSNFAESAGGVSTFYRLNGP